MEKLKILIVDDAPANIDVLSELLKNDYSLKIALSGQKALDIAFSDDPPQLILLDVMMPEMDGFAVCKILKENKKTVNIPIIFVTAKNQPVDEEMGLALGAVDYIIKPIHPAITKARIKTHTELLIQKNELLKEYEINRRELELARKIQSRFIPSGIPESESFSYYTLYKPMRQIGGDFFDSFELKDDTTGLLLADVSGHGIPAALITGMLKTVTLFHKKYMTRPDEFLVRINKHFVGLLDNNFITCLFATLQADPLSLVYANAGQPDILLLRKGSLNTISSAGVALGMFDEVPKYELKKVPLQSGDKLFFYTDGVTEGVNQDSDFGRELLLDTVKNHGQADIRSIIDTLHINLKINLPENQGFQDDISIIGIQVKE